MYWQHLILETSLKPFGDPAPDAIEATCRRLWSIWRPLADRAEQVSVLLWVGCGDEILTWSGDPRQPLPWAMSIGFCNYKQEGAYDPTNRHYEINQAVPYTSQPPEFNFADLRAIIRMLRSTAREMLGREIRIGATIDPGPEFVESPFRYQHHRELLQPVRPGMTYKMLFITHQAKVRGDDGRLAGFENGLPEGTAMGTYVGRQFEALRKFAGFDYIWFSNGFAYSHHPWGWRGELMDGERFYPEKAGEQRELVNAFWRDFRAACPAEIEVRGTNFSVAMDLSTDGCSHVDIAELGGLETVPTNPPWGSRALGLEMVSYLSRLSRDPTDRGGWPEERPFRRALAPRCVASRPKAPGARLPFRFYLNDPWFVSQPWSDYYGREPFDMYVPMSAAVLDGAGGVRTPTDLALLSIDSHTGELDEQQALETIPHFIRSIQERADAPGPVIWVYPFREYDQVLKHAPERLNHLFAHDWFMCRALEGGLPLNTVCSSDSFERLAETGKLPDAVYIAPAPAGDWAYASALLRHVERGGQVMLYGSLEHAPPPLLDALGVKLSEPIEGDFTVEQRRIEGDRFIRAARPAAGEDPSMAAVGKESGKKMSGSFSGSGQALQKNHPDTFFVDPANRPLRHKAITSGGGLREVCDWDDPAVRVIVEKGGRRRVYAISRQRDTHGSAMGLRGRLMWHRGTVGFDPEKNTLEPIWDPPQEVQQPAEWFRSMLGDAGLRIVQDRTDEAVRPAYTFIKRLKGAWVFVGHKPDTSTRIWFRTADGAPAFTEFETPIVNGFAGESFGKTFNQEVRVFVKMKDGTVAIKKLPIPIGRYHFSVVGLTGADVTLYPDPAALEDGSLLVQPKLREGEVAFEMDRARGAVRIAGHTGSLYVSW